MMVHIPLHDVIHNEDTVDCEMPFFISESQIVDIILQNLDDCSSVDCVGVISLVLSLNGACSSA